MKIMFIVPRLHTNLSFQIKALLEANHQVLVLTQYKGKIENYSVVKPIGVGYSKIYNFLDRIVNKVDKRPVKNWWKLRLAVINIRELKKYIRAFKPELIFLREYQSLNVLVILTFAKYFGVRVILMTQTSKSSLFGSRWLLKLYLKIFNKLNVVAYCTPTRRTVDALSTIAVKAYYLPFVYVSQDASKMSDTLWKIRILTIGKFIERKEFLLLLEVINKLISKFDIHLTIIGELTDEAYYKRVVNFIKNNKLESYVDIKLDLPYEQTLEEYKKSDLFVLPSYGEAAAYSIVEAMAHKLPVICSDDCGTNCYIKHGYNGLIFKAKDAKSLEDALISIMDIGILRKMGENGFERAKNFHSLKYYQGEFNKMISDIL